MDILTNVEPPLSLGVEIKVTSGINQIQRPIGSRNALYLLTGSNIGNDVVELPPNASWTSNPSAVTSVLMVSTSGPVEFNAVNTSGSITAVINKVLLWDSPLTSFTLTNTGTDTIRLTINQVSAHA